MKIMIVDDEISHIDSISTLVRKLGHETLSASSGTAALELIERVPKLDIVMVDQVMPNMTGLELGEKLNEINPTLYKIMVTAYGNMENAIEAMRTCFDDYLTKPCRLNDIEASFLRARKLLDEKQYSNGLREQIVTATTTRKPLIGDSPAFKEAVDRARRAANSNSLVLILGETGSGKELIARFIHDNSKRSGECYVVCNCAAMPEGLIESELFGHEKGAFPNANCLKKGWVEVAEKGTLFLDEIGELSLAVQSKFLRLLQENEYHRVGGTKNYKADIRIVAATHRDLEAMVQDGTFRKDLYYRLKVVDIRLPPLRERKEDIPKLAQHFVTEIARQQGKGVVINEEAITILTTMPFPGGIRELSNFVEKLVTLNETGTIDKNQVLAECQQSSPTLGAESVPLPRDISAQGEWWSELDTDQLLDLCRKIWETKGAVISNKAENIPGKLTIKQEQADLYLRAALAVFWEAHRTNKKIFSRATFDQLFGFVKDQNELKNLLQRRSQGVNKSPYFPVKGGSKMFGVTDLQKDGAELKRSKIFFDVGN